jgi:shikimate kinase
MNLKLERTPGIYLVGFMGSGKSTVGRRLAHHVGWSFFDLDDEIEAAERTPIAVIFDSRGETEFRRIEAQMLRQHVASIERGQPAVLALGGGAFAQSQNRQVVENNGVTVWLDCPFEIVFRRVAPTSHRPNARDPEKFRALYWERVESYRLADIHVAIESDDADQTVEAILKHPLFQ